MSQLGFQFFVVHIQCVLSWNHNDVHRLHQSFLIQADHLSKSSFQAVSSYRIPHFFCDGKADSGMIQTVGLYDQDKISVAIRFASRIHFFIILIAAESYSLFHSFISLLCGNDFSALQSSTLEHLAAGTSQHSLTKAM